MIVTIKYDEDAGEYIATTEIFGKSLEGSGVSISEALRNLADDWEYSNG